MIFSFIRSLKYHALALSANIIKCCSLSKHLIFPQPRLTVLRADFELKSYIYTYSHHRYRSLCVSLSPAYFNPTLPSSADIDAHCRLLVRWRMIQYLDSQTKSFLVSDFWRKRMRDVSLGIDLKCFYYFLKKASICAFLKQVKFIWSIKSTCLAVLVCMDVRRSTKSDDVSIGVYYATRNCICAYILTLFTSNLFYWYNYHLLLFIKFYLILIILCIY